MIQKEFAIRYFKTWRETLKKGRPEEIEVKRIEMEIDEEIISSHFEPGKINVHYVIVYRPSSKVVDILRERYEKKGGWKLKFGSVGMGLARNWFIDLS